VPKFYHDLLNVPSELNEGHTLHEYWMGDSFGKYGVDLTVFGPYRMPARSYQFVVNDGDPKPSSRLNGCHLEHGA